MSKTAFLRQGNLVLWFRHRFDPNSYAARNSYLALAMSNTTEDNPARTAEVCRGADLGTCRQQ